MEMMRVGTSAGQMFRLLSIAHLRALESVLSGRPLKEGRLTGRLPHASPLYKIKTRPHKLGMQFFRLACCMAEPAPAPPPAIQHATT